MKFTNFSIWRGRLPHWRADDVTYFVTFRSRRPLNIGERLLLLQALLKHHGKALNILVLCILPERTDLIFTTQPNTDGSHFEFSVVIEKAKSKVGKLIIKKTGERFPPFYEESFDRIIRDENELEEKWLEIVESPVSLELVEDESEYPGLWVANAPEGV